MIMKNIVLLIAFIMGSGCCFGQFNDSTFYYIRYASTGVINKTNDANSYVLNNALNFNVHRKTLSVNTSSTWIYGQQNKNLTNNDFGVYADLDLFKDTKRFYYWGLLTYETSYSLKINRRLQAGGGIGYTAVKSNTANLVFSDGFLYETGDLINARIGPDLYQTVRNSFRTKFRWEIYEKVLMDGSFFYQPSITDISDYNFKSVTNITLKLKKWLGITASGTYNQINRTKRENLLITFGITMEKYF